MEAAPGMWAIKPVTNKATCPVFYVLQKALCCRHGAFCLIKRGVAPAKASALPFVHEKM